MKHFWIKTAHGTYAARRRLPSTFDAPVGGFELWRGHPLFKGSLCIAQSNDFDQLYKVAAGMRGQMSVRVKRKRMTIVDGVRHHAYVSSEANTFVG